MNETQTATPLLISFDDEATPADASIENERPSVHSLLLRKI
jgi:hypothetical protein